MIFDPVGGPALEALIEAAASKAVIVLYGLLDRRPASLDVGTVLFKGLTIRGYELFETTTDAKRRAAAVAFIVEHLAKGALTPVIDRTFALEEIRQAHSYLEAGGQVGKIVVTVGRDGDES